LRTDERDLRTDERDLRTGECDLRTGERDLRPGDRVLGDGDFRAVDRDFRATDRERDFHLARCGGLERDRERKDRFLSDRDLVLLRRYGLLDLRR